MAPHVQRHYEACQPIPDSKTQSQRLSRTLQRRSYIGTHVSNCGKVSSACWLPRTCSRYESAIFTDVLSCQPAYCAERWQQPRPATVASGMQRLLSAYTARLTTHSKILSFGHGHHNNGPWHWQPLALSICAMDQIAMTHLLLPSRQGGPWFTTDIHVHLTVAAAPQIPICG